MFLITGLALYKALDDEFQNQVELVLPAREAFEYLEPAGVHWVDHRAPATALQPYQAAPLAREKTA
jgi:hypothetical protein